MDTLYYLLFCEEKGLINLVYLAYIGVIIIISLLE